MIQWKHTGQDPRSKRPEIFYLGYSDATTWEDVERDLIQFWLTGVEVFILGLSMNGLKSWNSITIGLDDQVGRTRIQSAMDGRMISGNGIYVGVIFQFLRNIWYDLPDPNRDLQAFESGHAALMGRVTKSVLDAAATEEVSIRLRRLKEQAGSLRFYLQPDPDDNELVPLDL